MDSTQLEELIAENRELKEKVKKWESVAYRLGNYCSDLDESCNHWNAERWVREAWTEITKSRKSER